jgi:predicted nucleotidyltransferase
MDVSSKIIDSFSLRETLNSKVWEHPEDPNDAIMKKRVRQALMKIADAFIDDLGDDVKIEDITLTGSLANFNWSDFSDFDVHVIIDYSQFGKQKELYKELFGLKKQLFNQKHDIRIFGYEVELYAQDSSEEHTASGLYSIKDNKWINIPSRENFKLDKNLLKTKISSWKNYIEDLIVNINESGLDVNETKVKTLKDKLKEYRKSGLEKEGEYSYENLVFKFLRRSKIIEKLYDVVNKQSDKELSVEVKNIN